MTISQSPDVPIDQTGTPTTSISLQMASCFWDLLSPAAQGAACTLLPLFSLGGGGLWAPSHLGRLLWGLGIQGTFLR